MLGRYLRPVAVVVGLALGLPVVTGGTVTAMPLMPRVSAAVTDDMVGSSCVIAVSNDQAAIDASWSTSATIKLKCNWSPLNHGTVQTAEAIVFPDNTACDPGFINCAIRTTGVTTTITFWNYTGTPTGTPYQRHGAADGARTCTMSNYSAVRTGSLAAEYTFKCSATANGGFGCNCAHLENAFITGSGTTPFAGIGTGGTTHGNIASGSQTTWTGSFKRVTWATFDATEPEYTWDPPEACETLRMYIANPGRTINPGASMDVDFTSGIPALVLTGTGVLRYRWSPTDPWVAMYDAATYTGLVPTAWTVTNATGGARTGVTFEVECTGAGTAYLRGDNSAGEATPQAPRPCAAVVINWPDEGSYGPAETVPFSFVVGNSAGGDVTGMVISGGRFGNAQSDTVDVVTDASTVTFSDLDGTPGAFPVGPGGYLASFSFTNEWITDDGLFARCEDADGYLNLQYQAPATVGKLPIPEGYGDRFETCLDGVNFGWRPSSWVPAFFRTTACVAQVLFVPVDSDVTAFVDGWDALSAKAPVSFVSETGTAMYGLFDDLPSSLTAHRTDCTEVLPDSPDIGAPTGVSICPADLSSGTLTLVRGFLAAGVYIGTAFFLWQSTRRVLAS